MSVSVIKKIGNSCSDELGYTRSGDLWGHDPHSHCIYGETIWVPSESDLESVSDNLQELRKTNSNAISNLRDKVSSFINEVNGRLSKQSSELTKTIDTIKKELKQRIQEQLSDGGIFFERFAKMTQFHIDKVQSEVSKIQKTSFEASSALQKANELSEQFKTKTDILLAELKKSVENCKKTDEELKTFATHRLVEISEKYEHGKHLLGTIDEKLKLFTDSLLPQIQQMEKKAEKLQIAIEHQEEVLKATERRMAELEEVYWARLKAQEQRQAERMQQQEQTILELQERLERFEAVFQQFQTENQSNAASFGSRLAWLFRGNRRTVSKESTMNDAEASEGNADDNHMDE